jgi:pimeloyl-ACP methyl ester carboxylesterase
MPKRIVKMPQIYKSQEGERLVRERYLAFLKRWPTANERLRVPTREGETFVVASGDSAAPPLMLFHGSAGNAAMWMGDVAAWAAYFRVYAIDMIGEPGLSAASRPPLGSEAYALWLDDVMRGLCVQKAAIVGVSLGGWLALDYATRRPERVGILALLCPGGVGAQKLSFLFKSIPLLLLGRWGQRKLSEMILRRAPKSLPPGIQAFLDFVALIHRNFRPRRGKLPIFQDAELKRLTMPVLAIVGGKDVLLDSSATKRRLEQNAFQVEVRYLPEAGHLIRGQTVAILEFLRREAVAERSRWSRNAAPTPQR